MQQVTERIEKKLEELPNIDYQKSYTKPGESVVFVYLVPRGNSWPFWASRSLWKCGQHKRCCPQSHSSRLNIKQR
jgi:hypothetical protein